MDTLLSRIMIDPVICHGKPCVRGLRYPVEVLLELRRPVAAAHGGLVGQRWPQI